MSFTYSGDPSEGDVDEIRYLIGDTVETGHVIEDEEILWELSQQTNRYRVAARCCRQVARKQAVTNNGVQAKTVGDLTVSYAATATQDWLGAAEALESLATFGAQPFARGYRVSEHALSAQDNDVRPWPVTIGFTDNPGTVSGMSTST